MGTSTANADFANVANWQGVDIKPLSNSKNIPDSNAVYELTGYSVETVSVQASASYPYIQINYIKGKNKLFYSLKTTEFTGLTIYLMYYDNSFDTILHEAPAFGMVTIEPDPEKTPRYIRFGFDNAPAVSYDAILTYIYLCCDINLLKEEVRLNFAYNNAKQVNVLFKGSLQYPQYNFDYQASIGDDLYIRLSDFENIWLCEVYQYNSNGTYEKLASSIESLIKVTLKSNYNGKIRIVCYLQSSVDTIKTIRYGSLKDLGDIDKINLTLQESLYALNKKLYNSCIVKTEVLSGSVAYPQINLTYNATEGDEVYFRIEDISNVSFWQVYQFKNDNTYEQNDFIEPVGKIKIGSNYNNKIRIIFYFSNAVDTKITVHCGSLSDFGDVDYVGSTFQNLILAPRMYSVLILQRVGCIGDSYTSGHIQLNGGEAIPSNPNYSWPHYMEKLTGNTYTNFGVSGATTKAFVQQFFDQLGIGNEANKCQAYIIGLGINDSGWANIPAGSASDIGTDSDTYTAWYYKLVQKVLIANPTAKIFLLTMPRENVSDYNSAVKNIVNYYRNNQQTNIYLCDLELYEDRYYYKNIFMKWDLKNGHYTALGYEFFAECFINIISNIIKANFSEFEDIHLVPFSPANL